MTTKTEALEAFARTMFELNLHPPGWGPLNQKWDDQTDADRECLLNYYGRKYEPLRAALSPAPAGEVSWSDIGALAEYYSATRSPDWELDKYQDAFDRINQALKIADLCASFSPASPQGGEVSEAMLEAGYDATRDERGMPRFADAGFCLSHVYDIYLAMQAAKEPTDA